MPDESKLITGDGKISDTEKNMLTDPGGAVVLDSVEQLKAFAQMAKDRFDAFDERIQEVMTEPLGKIIRMLRVEQDYSWREVANQMSQHPEFTACWSPPSNQLAGMALCQRAALMFGEKYMSPPWN